MSRRMTFNGKAFAPLGIGLVASLIAGAVFGEAVIPLALLGFTAVSAAALFLLLT